MVQPHATTPQVVLIVEDELDLLDTLKDALMEAANVRVLTAAAPDLVVPLVEVAPPAVVVLDIGLPGMSGWEVLAALRQHQRFRTLPVLIVSGMPDAPARVAQLQDPWVVFLAKPLHLQTLLEQVQTLLARHRHAAETPPAPDTLS